MFLGSQPISNGGIFMAKMSKKKFTKIFLPISSVALAFAIAVPVLSNMYSTTLDTALGQGKLHVIAAEGSENWDTDYVEQKYTSEADARAAGEALTKKIADEGIVLLKNDNNALPLSKGDKVAPVGYAYKEPVYGGSGSGNVDTSKPSIITPQKALANAGLSVVGSIEKITLNQQAADIAEAAGTLPAIAGSGMFKNDFRLKAAEPSIYNSAKADFNGAAAIIFIGRGGGEGNDIKRDGYTDGTRHYLTLSQNEKDTIEYARNNGASKVIAIINSSNVMELDCIMTGKYAADAILWVGGPGSTGFEAMGDILVNNVNPSGKTADIYAKDFFNDPTYVNIGNFEYSNAKYDGEKTAHYVEYEEGIYVGYKYYETAAAEGENYNDLVTFPFGHGLSYTTFDQKITKFNTSGGKISVTVEVKNTGNVAGKDVVQIYWGADYTDFDKTNKIERSAKNLVEFAKTGVIEPGKTETVTVEFNTEDLASYCYTRTNPDGTVGCYVLEKGDYDIFLGKNSHDSYDSKVFAQGSTVWFDNTNPRQSEKDGQAILEADGTLTNTPAKVQVSADAEFVAATNKFQESSDYMNESGVTMLTRADWKNTKPTAGTVKALEGKYLATFNANKKDGFNAETDANLGNVASSKVYNNDAIKFANSGYDLSQMRGKDYYDEEWDVLLDQIDFSSADVQEELRDLLFYGAYNTAKLTSIGKISTKDYDGPQGFSSFMDFGHDWCAYCSEVVVSSTWNIELVEEYGAAVADEAIAGTSKIAGWYAPAMNIHRSPFAGRNFEYYSEDGVLAGKIAASVITGAAKKGCYAYMKHFALNDQETNRTDSICTWATEQAMREVYLRPFELVAKYSRGQVSYTADAQGTKASKITKGCTAVMSSFNCVGATMASSNYGLLTGVLRDEWGFQGAVITDFGPVVNYDAMIRSGNDFLLNANWGGAKPALDQVFADTTSNTAKHVMREAVKNISYTVVNSLAYDEIAPGSTSYRDVSPWKIWFGILTGVFAACALTGFCLTIIKNVKKNED